MAGTRFAMRSASSARARRKDDAPQRLVTNGHPRADRPGLRSAPPPGRPRRRLSECRYVGLRQTFDLVVNGPWHNFVANGIVVHNSFNEFSMRYAKATDEFYVPDLDDVRSQVGKPGAYTFEPVDPALAEATRDELRPSTNRRTPHTRVSSSKASPGSWREASYPLAPIRSSTGPSTPGR